MTVPLLLIAIAMPFIVVKVKDDMNFYKDMAEKSHKQTKEAIAEANKAIKGWEACTKARQEGR